MTSDSAALEGFEISPRFRSMIEARIARLEHNARFDESTIEHLENIDHIRRQMRLVSAQRAEATRMRQFLDRSAARQTRPMIAL
jgi:uncharacterized coiled-coil protein SlyX